MIRPTVDFTATLLVRPARWGRRIVRPWVRLARLVSLRSRCDGRIPLTTQFDGAVNTAGRVRLSLGEHCRLGRNVFFETCQGGRIRLGAQVRINMGCVLVSYAGITIGDGCLIGEYVSIRDADHGMDRDRPMRLQPHRARPIVIEDNVWIGRGAAVLKGVTIGTGAVVAANSVVTRDVPAHTLVGGVPARILRSLRSRVDDHIKAVEPGTTAGIPEVSSR